MCLIVSSLDYSGYEERKPLTVIRAIYIVVLRESSGIVDRDVHREVDNNNGRILGQGEQKEGNRFER